MGLYRFGGYNESKRFFKEFYEPILGAGGPNDNWWLGTNGPIHRGPFPFPMGEIQEGSKWTPGIRVRGLNEAVDIFYGMRSLTINELQGHKINERYPGVYRCRGQTRRETIAQYLAGNNGFGEWPWRHFGGNSGAYVICRFTERAYYEVANGKKTGYIFLDLSLWLPYAEQYIIPIANGDKEEAWMDRPVSVGISSPRPEMQNTIFRHVKKMSANGIEFELILYDLCGRSFYPNYPNNPSIPVVEDATLWNCISGVNFFE